MTDEPVATASIVASFAALAERMKDHARPENPDCEKCSDAGWIIREETFGKSMVYEVVDPCPDCKPDWVHPDERKPEEIETTDEKRTREAKAVSGDAKRWWD